MAQLRELKGRIKAVGNIKRITNTMQMIATAKFQAASRRAIESKPYTRKVNEFMRELASAASEGQVDHPLLTGPEQPTRRELLLIITSNRGLCGAYNANILRTVDKHLKSHPDVTFDIQVVGKKGMAWCRFNSIALDRQLSHFADEPTYDQVEAVADEFMQRFEARRYDAVRVVYMQFISNARQTPTVMTLLPLAQPGPEDPSDGADEAPAGSFYEFSPDPATLLAELVPLAVKATLFQVFNDAVVSEHVARMVAMKGATDNADQMNRTLTRTYNRARQAQITTELNEIVSGAAALE
jgi:F-type H+-transporting ATPase subunit gamma